MLRRFVSHPLLATSIAVAVGGLITAPATAQRRPARQAAAEPAAATEGGEATTMAVPVLSDLPSIIEKLHSGDPALVREGIDLLTIFDRPESIPPIAELLRRGQPDTITDRALEALAALAKPESIDLLAEFTHHYREAARRRAYQALTGIADPRVPALVAQGLRDGDRGIRSACALALGDMSARGSVDVLFRAFDRGVLEAAISIGKLGDAQAVTRFNESLGRQPLSIMLSGYEQFVRRRDIAEAVKLDIVARLGEVSGPMVKTFLRQYLGTFSERDRGAIRRAVEETIRRIPEGPAQGSSGGAR